MVSMREENLSRGWPMQMVSKKNWNRTLLLTAFSFLGSVVAYAAVSPRYSAVQAKVAPLDKAKITCSGQEYEKDAQARQKKQQCESQCLSKFDEVKQQTKRDVAAGAANDSNNNIGATAGAKNAEARTVAAQKDQMKGAGSANGVGKEALTNQARNLFQVGQKLKSCSSEIESACSDDFLLSQKDKDGKKKATEACDQAAAEANKGATEAKNDADQMAKDEQKNEKNAEGMKPPEMPKGGGDQQSQNPQQAENKSDVSTPETKSSGLGGNQLANKVAVGDGVVPGTGGASTKHEASSSYPGYSSVSGSGYSPYSSGSGTEARNSSGSSGSSGGLGGGFGGGGDSGAKAVDPTSAAALLAAKQEAEAGESGAGGRPSFMGMKSHGNELAELGIDPNAAQNALDAMENSDRAPASEQAADIHAQDSETLFHMIHNKLSDIGKRGAI